MDLSLCDVEQKMKWFCRFPALFALACLLTQCVQNQPGSELMDNAGLETELQDFSYAGYQQVCSTLEADLANNCSIGPVDTHESLAIANLFDLVELDDGLEIGNRQGKSSSVGPTGTLNVIWNVKGSGYVNSYNTGTGYVFGSEPSIKLYHKLDEAFPKARAIAPNTGAEDFIQSAGQMMAEPLLYVLQLQKRRAGK
jgi:hypothetical protein